MDVSLPMYRACLSKRDHNHASQRMGVLSLACAAHVDVDGGDIHPRHKSTQGIQPHGMDAVVYAARALNAVTPKP